MTSNTPYSRDVSHTTFGDGAFVHTGDIRTEHNYNPQARQGNPLRPFPLIPFARDPDFVDRGDILNQISRRCLETAGRAALFGLGGVGKSQLAIEFAHRVAEKHNDIWVFWIHAATQARVEAGFRMIADAVELSGRDKPDANIPRLVQNWLSNEHNGRWIIALDSVDDDEVLYGADKNTHDQQPLATCIPQSRKGSIVLTTRSRSIAAKLTGGYKDIIEVGPMGETDALALLEKKLIAPLSPSDADVGKELVKTLDCIPLAISQAAAYILERKPRSSIEHYLHELRERERESMRPLTNGADDMRRDKEGSIVKRKLWTSIKKHFLELRKTKQKSLEPLNYDLNYEVDDMERDREASVAILKTWTISFEHIRSQRRSAADLLSLMSFFDRQGIPEWVLTKSPDRTENSESKTGPDFVGVGNSRFEEDILLLRNYCLISVTAEGKTFEMHRLVQLSVKNWLRAVDLQETFMQQYIKRMAASFPPADYENWAICQELFPHVQVTLEYRPNEDTVIDWAALCYYGACYAQDQGKYDIAYHMASKAKEAEENKLGKKHNSTLLSASLLALIMTRRGQWEEAEELQLQVLETHKAKLGADHLQTLTSINSLTLTYSKQGRLEEAEKLQLQVLETRKAKLGVDHLETLISINNLALTYSKQGRLEEAEKLQLQVLENLKAKLGANHLKTLTIINNLAVIYGKRGRLEEAKELQLQVLETRKAKLGANHPDTITTIKTLKYIWQAQGRHEKALAQMKECVQASHRVLGPQHFKTLRFTKKVEKWSSSSD